MPYRHNIDDLTEDVRAQLGPERGAFGLTQKEVERLRRIIARECGVELSNQEAWARAIELMALAKRLLNALPPYDKP